MIGAVELEPWVQYRGDPEVTTNPRTCSLPAKLQDQALNFSKPSRPKMAVMAAVGLLSSALGIRGRISPKRLTIARQSYQALRHESRHLSTTSPHPLGLVRQGSLPRKKGLHSTTICRLRLLIHVIHKRGTQTNHKQLITGKFNHWRAIAQPCAH